MYVLSAGLNSWPSYTSPNAPCPKGLKTHKIKIGKMKENHF